MFLSIQKHLLPYVPKLTVRAVTTIRRVVIHCTELPDLDAARAFGEQVRHANGTGNSGHYYIDRDGTICRYVPDNRIAHHVRGHNADSIGIELINKGRYPDWFHTHRQTMSERYAEAQIVALTGLLAQLCRVLPNLCHIFGHEDLDITWVPASNDPTRQVRRKCDPGPLFPWPTVLASSTLRHPYGR